jgi:NADH dehydrogenase
MGGGFDLLATLTGGLLQGPLTLDQVRNLARDNVVTGSTRTFEDLGIAPVAMDAILPDYLWRFRPAGQYAAMLKSARNLRD